MANNGREKKRAKYDIPETQDIDFIDEEDDNPESADPLGGGLPHGGIGKLQPGKVYRLSSGFDPAARSSKSGTIPEFRKVEKMMRPQTFKNGITQQRWTSLTSSSKRGDYIANAIDLSEDDSDPKPSYRGTARLDAKPRAKVVIKGAEKSAKRRETGLQSGFFENEPSRSRQALLVSSNVDNESVSTNGNLRDKFVQSDGRRRHSSHSSSSDDIQEYEEVKRLSPAKQTGQSSTKKAQSISQALTTLENSLEIEKSNIPPTQFTESKKPKDVSTNSKRKNRNHNEAVSGWEYEASTVIWGSYHILDDSKSIGITSKNGRDIDIMWRSFSLAERLSLSNLKQGKLQKIVWADSSHKLQLETALCTGSEATGGKIQIQLCSEKDVTMLIQNLTGMNHLCLVLKKPAGYLDSIFERRLKETEICTEEQLNDRSRLASDLKLAERNAERRNARLSMEQRLSPAREKLSKKLDHGIEAKAEGVKSESLSKVDNRDKANVLDCLVGKLNPTSHNSHLTRSKSGSKPALSASHTNSVFFDHFPEELRYSKIHGLGPRWSKPLIFPKSGKKKSTVEFTDLERLDEGEFLNDNLVSFHLRHLEFRLEQKYPEIAKKIYFFNTFFFASLTNTARSKKRVNYEAVQKWTRSIDIFTYDFVVVPINESAHWYVAIICNLPALNREQDPSESQDIVMSSPTIPNIISLDGTDESPLQNSGYFSRPSNISAKTQSLVGAGSPDETKARESFAEMQLDDELTATKPEDQEVHSTDDHFAPSAFSEAQNLNKPTVLHDTDPQNVTEDRPNGETLIPASPDFPKAEASSDHDLVHDTIRLADPSPVSHTASAKKGKRKSQPPVKRYDPNQPAIIILDSLGLSHFPTVKVLKEYLHEEGKAKRGGMEWEDGQLKGMTAKNIPIQDNFCDCGLFLLGYIEKFLENPREFVVKTLRKEHDVERDWPLLVPSEMRKRMRDLIFKLHNEQHRDNALAADKHRGSRLRKSTSHVAEPTAKKRKNSTETRKAESSPRSNEHLMPGSILPIDISESQPDLAALVDMGNASDRGDHGNADPSNASSGELAKDRSLVILDSQPEVVINLPST